MITIRLFSTPTCVYCRTIKTFFDENNIKYKEIDVSSNIEALEEMIEKTKQMFVPVINIGDEYIIGFDKKILCEKLNIIE